MKEMIVDGNERFDFINQVLNDNSVKDIEFRNCDFLNEELLKIVEFKNYERIAFIDCSFEDESLIKNLKTESLSLTNNTNNSYEFIYEMVDLRNLTVVNGRIDAYKLNALSKLEYLRVSHSFVVNIEKLFLEDLKFLFIDNTNIDNLSFVKNFPNLNLLSISEKQKVDNINTLKSILIRNHIKIIMDSIVEMEVDIND